MMVSDFVALLALVIAVPTIVAVIACQVAEMNLNRLDMLLAMRRFERDTLLKQRWRKGGDEK